MASKSRELRVTLLGLALVALLLLSHDAAPVAAENDASGSSFVGSSRAGGRTLASFSMNHDSSQGESRGGKAGGGQF